MWLLIHSSPSSGGHGCLLRSTPLLHQLPINLTVHHLVIKSAFYLDGSIMNFIEACDSSDIQIRKLIHRRPLNQGCGDAVVEAGIIVEPASNVASDTADVEAGAVAVDLEAGDGEGDVKASIVMEAARDVEVVGVVLFLPFTGQLPMVFFSTRRPHNLVSWIFYTLCMSLMVGWLDATQKGEFIWCSTFII